MKYLSVCSGIEAATVAWHPLGWEAVAYSEIEPFPSAVLAHHYPNVPNVGDMTKFKEWNLEPIELLVGGTPCQSFSVAGLRKGLEDPRGNLALVYCGILDKLRPRWFVWENVPGVLSSNGGRDFGSFLGAVAELGYGFAYRVLDAQYFGVAQRRRRVFVVGYFGDWNPAAKVLFEPESLRGNTPTSKKQRKEVAGDARASIEISYDMKQHHNPQPSDTVQLTTKNCSFIRGDTPLVQSYALQGAGTTSRTGNGAGWNEEVSFTLNSIDVHGVAQPIYMGNAEGGALEKPFLTCHNLGGTAGISNQTPLIAQPIVLMDQGGSVMNVLQDGTVGTLRRETHGHEPVVMQSIVAPTLTASNDPSRSPQSTEVTNQIAAVHAASMAVRRLTPVECERLQGFPDNYTNIPWRKAQESPDGPRYKALGNSMAVPVMRWIGERINQYEQQAKRS